MNKTTNLLNADITSVIIDNQRSAVQTFELAKIKMFLLLALQMSAYTFRPNVPVIKIQVVQTSGNKE